MRNWTDENSLECKINSVIDSYTEMNECLMGKENADEKAESTYKWAINAMNVNKLVFGTDYIKKQSRNVMFSEKFAENLLKEVTEKIAF